MFGTDEVGEFVSHIQYDEWGLPAVVVQGVLEPNYTGHGALQVYYGKARMYDPNLKRFLAADPIKGVLTNPQSMNAYAYVLNNPLKFVDLVGLTYKNILALFDEYGIQYSIQTPAGYDPDMSLLINSLIGNSYSESTVSSVRNVINPGERYTGFGSQALRSRTQAYRDAADVIR